MSASTRRLHKPVAASTIPATRPGQIDGSPRMMDYAPMNNPHPPVDAVLETSLYVASLEASRDFYTRLFGFPVYLQDERMVALGVPGRGVLLLFARGGSLQGSATPMGKIPGHDAAGRQHLAFAISPDTLREWEAHLAREKIAVESKITWPRGGTSLYFRDPDNHSVEVATPGLWPDY